MQSIEEQALATYKQTVPLWLRYVDDTFTAVHKDEIDTFHEHLNRQNTDIQFTGEVEENGKIPFSRLSSKPTRQQTTDYYLRNRRKANTLRTFSVRTTTTQTLLNATSTKTTNPTQLTPNLSPQLEYPTSRALLRLSHGSCNLTTSVSLTNRLRLYDNF